jgi:hypothetical protein
MRGSTASHGPLSETFSCFSVGSDVTSSACTPPLAGRLITASFWERAAEKGKWQLVYAGKLTGSEW